MIVCGKKFTQEVDWLVAGTGAGGLTGAVVALGLGADNDSGRRVPQYTVEPLPTPVVVAWILVIIAIIWWSNKKSRRRRLSVSLPGCLTIP